MEKQNFGLEFWLASGGMLAALVVFGLAYNQIVAELENKGHDRGYVGFLVALGVFVTLVAASLPLGILLSPTVASAVLVVDLAAFSASGAPMILGSVRRYVRVRARGEKELEGLPAWLRWLEGGDDRTEDRQDQLESGDK